MKHAKFNNDDNDLPHDCIKYMLHITEYSSDEQQSVFEELYTEVCFEHTAANSKQLALKIFMNTFYGETGNALSPFFLLQIAGGVTSAGQYNIKMVHDFVVARGNQIKYGDTDSLYISLGHSTFDDIDQLYAFGKLPKKEYWTEMVKLTMVGIAKLCVLVNDYLYNDNGTTHLKMSYEEVLHPVVFTGKKKYFGIPHISVPNYSPKNLFIRGIDVVKQGQTPLAVKIGERIMWAAMSIDNTRDLFTIVKDVLNDAVVNTSQWNFSDFVQSAAWRPDKDNKCVQSFISRMQLRVDEERQENEDREKRGLEVKRCIYTIPDPGERFQYVLVEKRELFNIRGLKINYKQGDLMEFADVAKELNMPVNIAQYINSYIVSLCARFINYAAQFAHADDKTSQDAAKKYLEKYVVQLQLGDMGSLQEQGRLYKRIWKCTISECTDSLHEDSAIASHVLHGAYLNWEIFTGSTSNIVAVFIQSIKDYAKTLTADTYAEQFVKAINLDCTNTSKIYELVKYFKPARKAVHLSTRAEILASTNKRESYLRMQLDCVLPKVIKIVSRYSNYIRSIINKQRSYDNCDTRDRFTLEPQDIEHLFQIYELWHKFAGVYSVRNRNAAIIIYLRELINSNENYHPGPDRSTLAQLVHEDTKNIAHLVNI